MTQHTQHTHDETEMLAQNSLGTTAIINHNKSMRLVKMSCQGHKYSTMCWEATCHYTHTNATRRTEEVKEALLCGVHVISSLHWTSSLYSHTNTVSTIALDPHDAQQFKCHWNAFQFCYLFYALPAYSWRTCIFMVRRRHQLQCVPVCCGVHLSW